MELAGVLAICWLILMLVYICVRIAFFVVTLPLRFMRYLYRRRHRRIARPSDTRTKVTVKWDLPIQVNPTTGETIVAPPRTTPTPRPPRHESNLWPPPTYESQSF